jgi:hypothetical protein
VLTLYNGIDGAALLAQSAVDAFGHVNVVARRSPTAIHTLLGLDRDSLRRADGFTKLAGDATLFTRGIPSQGVLAPEAG